MRPEQAASIVRLVEYGWTTGSFEPEHAVVYLDGIADLPFEPTEAAVRTMIRTDTWRPAVADIRRRVAGLTGQLPPGDSEAVGQARALVAWRDDAQFGAAHSPEPDVHPAVRAACDGVDANSNWNWTNAFLRFYRRVVDTTEREVVAANFTTLLALESPE